MLPAICWMNKWRNHAVCFFLHVVCEEQIWVRMHDTCTGMGAQGAPPMHLRERHQWWASPLRVPHSAPACASLSACTQIFLGRSRSLDLLRPSLSLTSSFKKVLDYLVRKWRDALKLFLILQGFCLPLWPTAALTPNSPLNYTLSTGHLGFMCWLWFFYRAVNILIRVSDSGASLFLRGLDLRMQTHKSMATWSQELPCGL